MLRKIMGIERGLSLNFGEQETHKVYYLRKPDNRETDFGVTSVQCIFLDLIALSGVPQ